MVDHMAEKELYKLADIVNVVGAREKYLGYYVLAGPEHAVGAEEGANQMTEINFTGKPGTASAIYYSLFFQLPKWDWHIQKATEWIEVTPTHKEYYDRTMATKQMLESTIKTGLASAAQAVADYELLTHDLRRYKEIVTYFERDDEHALKSIFIDQVDLHTGNLSISEMTRNRWPTMTADFHKLKDEYMDVETIEEKLDISKAEAIVLATKNRLYTDWKKLFRGTVEERYRRLRSMALSREKSIDEYKEWLKPYISRFRTTRLGTGQPSLRTMMQRSFMDVAGLSTFLNDIVMYAWKPVITREFGRASAEKMEDFRINPYDDFIRNNLILGGDYATVTNPRIKPLADIYQWLRDELKYCGKCDKYFSSGHMKCEKCGSLDLQDKTVADQIVNNAILKGWGTDWGTNSSELYYMFLDIDIFRLGIRLPVGEMEDITFTNRMYVISQNVLLVKILELICRDMELERYIEEMLGFRSTKKELEQILKEEHSRTYGEAVPKLTEREKNKFSKGFKDNVRSFTGFFKNIKFPETGLMFVKPGPYEAKFRDRVTKQYLKVSGSNFGQVSGLIKSKMGMV